MRVAAFFGESGSGKTTAIAALIAHFVAHGERVGAVKHTHHPINDDDRGDTAQFRRAGAEPVILAGQGIGVMFKRDGIERIAFTHPRDLLENFDTDIVLIEGFKSVDAWPRVELDRDQRRSIDELVVILDRIWRA